jgi:hypothetical protein
MPFRTQKSAGTKAAIEVAGADHNHANSAIQISGWLALTARRQFRSKYRAQYISQPFLAFA